MYLKCQYLRKHYPPTESGSPHRFNENGIFILLRQKSVIEGKQSKVTSYKETIWFSFENQMKNVIERCRSLLPKVTSFTKGDNVLSTETLINRF